MSSYQPDQRLVRSRIFTSAGWIEADMHVGRKTPLIDHLNRPESLFRLTNVILPGHENKEPFFALVRSSVAFVVPLDPTDFAPPIEGKVTHRTVWLLRGGIVIEGQLDLHPGIRVSDHLEHRSGFIALHDCALYFPAQHGATTVVPRVPCLSLQTERAIGASEVPEPGEPAS